MGRASNSFSSYVGHALEINNEKVSLPEKDLWVAVLMRAALDACKGPPRLNMHLRSNVTHKNNYTYDRDQARHFFLEGGAHFNLICELAGRNPAYVQNRVRKVLLRRRGLECGCSNYFSLSPRTCCETKTRKTQKETSNRKCVLCSESRKRNEKKKYFLSSYRPQGG